MLDYLGDFFSSLLNGLFTFVGFAVNLILTPINFAINQFIPNNSWITSVEDFFASLSSYANYVLSFTGIEQHYFDVVITMWVFILSVPLTVRVIKTAVLWFKTLKVG